MATPPFAPESPATRNTASRANQKKAIKEYQQLPRAALVSLCHSLSLRTRLEKKKKSES
jgi:hypothetical protein